MRMPGETEQLDRDGFPPGARPTAAARLGRLWIPPIRVRADQAADEPPAFVRARFGWSVREVSGSLGDLGTAAGSGHGDQTPVEGGKCAGGTGRADRRMAAGEGFGVREEVQQLGSASGGDYLRRAFAWAILSRQRKASASPRLFEQPAGRSNRADHVGPAIGIFAKAA